MTSVGIVTGAGRGMGRACADRLASMVDHLLLVDLDESTLDAATTELTATGSAVVEPFTLDVTDRDGLGRLAARVAEAGTLRAVAHAAGISPTMADWKRILTVDLVGTARLADTLRPLVTTGTAMVCFSSMSAAMLAAGVSDPAADAALDEPLDDLLLDRLHDALGPTIEDSGLAYAWAKRGVQRFVQQEAVRVGPLGGRVCSLSPGIIDTPQGRQEAEEHAVMAEFVKRSALGRTGRSEEIANVVTFLLSDDASFLTGVDILVDGGACAAVLGPAAQS